MNDDKEFQKIVSIISFLVSAFFIILGFYKILFYENGKYIDDSINAYVTGDAYNYIINANYAGAYFILALLFTIIACTFLILSKIETY